jgi:HD-like signal output (HDOD) protein
MQEKDFDSLLIRLTREEMPIFSNTVKYIVDASVRQNAPVTDLAWGILRDPSLTAKVLRFANSIYYNPSFSKTSTISRAILQLGLDMVKSICVSASLVEELLKGAPRQRMLREMTRAFHAAVQAKSLATLRKQSSVEEVFIAALLYRVGYLAFWCFGGDPADKLEAVLQDPNTLDTLAEQEVLGFRIHKLGVALAREWHLGPLVELSLEGNAKSDPRVYNIILGHKLAHGLEMGWDCPDAEAAIAASAKYLKLDLEETREIVYENAKAAVEVAKDYGMGQYSSLILLPRNLETKVASDEKTEEPVRYQEPDPLLQLEILKELTTFVNDGQSDYNLLFSTLLEGIYRGIGMDRVLLLLVSPDRRNVVGKFGLGWEQSKVDLFSLTLDTAVPHIFSYVLEEKKPAWVQGQRTPRYLGYLTPEIKSFLSTPSFFVMPLAIRKRVIGFVCADRHTSGRALDEASFSSFSFFGQIVNTTLSTSA